MPRVKDGEVACSHGRWDATPRRDRPPIRRHALRPLGAEVPRLWRAYLVDSAAPRFDTGPESPYSI